jgi:hypothetical protein
MFVPESLRTWRRSAKALEKAEAELADIETHFEYCTKYGINPSAAGKWESQIPAAEQKVDVALGHYHDAFALYLSDCIQPAIGKADAAKFLF